MQKTDGRSVEAEREQYCRKQMEDLEGLPYPYAQTLKV